MNTRSTSFVFRFSLVLSALIFAVAASLAAQQADQHEMGAHHHPEAAKLTNPVAADATSIAAGRMVFAKSCSGCHGDTGAGDGMMGEDMEPKFLQFPFASLATFAVKSFC